jgi:hypothetical protein
VRVAVAGQWQLKTATSTYVALGGHDVLGFQVPPSIERLQLSLLAALGGIGAVLIEKPWPDFRETFRDLMVGRMRQQVAYNPGQPLEQVLGAALRVRSFSVGHGDPPTR